MTKKIDGFQCHFELALGVISGKWKILILYFIADEEIIRYSTLRKRIKKINERMLSRQLKELEKDKLIIRTVYNEVPPRVEYRLSDVGIELMPLLCTLQKFGERYEAAVPDHDIEIDPCDDFLIKANKGD